MNLAHLVPQIALVLGAAGVLVTALAVRRDRQWWAAVVAGVGLAAAAGTQLGLLDTTAQLTVDGVWALDGALSWTSILIVAATAVVVAMAPEWFATDPRGGEYHAMILLGAVGAVGMAGAADLNQLIAALLLTSVAGYVLAAYHRGSGASTEAGMKFFLVAGMSNALLLIGAVLLYGVAGTTRYADLAAALAGGDPAVMTIGIALVVVGLALEVGAVPAHAWMPDVAEGAPAPSAAFLTVVPKLGALVALARLLPLIPAEATAWRPMVAVVAAATMTLGNLAALWQDDVRRLLGWSSVSQSGYGLMAVVVIGTTDLALPALLTFLAGYAAANLAAFGVVVELRGRTRLEDYAGLARERPWAALALTVAMLSLVGIPPLIGFTAKLQLFLATIDGGFTWLAVVAVVNTVVSLFYYLRVIGRMVLADAPGPVPVLGRAAAVATAVATGAVVALGLAAGPLLDAFSGTALVP